MACDSFTKPPRKSFLVCDSFTNSPKGKQGFCESTNNHDPSHTRTQQPQPFPQYIEQETIFVVGACFSSRFIHQKVFFGLLFRPFLGEGLERWSKEKRGLGSLQFLGREGFFGSSQFLGEGGNFNMLITERQNVGQEREPGYGRTSLL